ncbi:hypothetical protein VTK56DRAFT_7607 [Thermocarpiscus australiensis]
MPNYRHNNNHENGTGTRHGGGGGNAHSPSARSRRRGGRRHRGGDPRYDRNDSSRGGLGPIPEGSEVIQGTGGLGSIQPGQPGSNLNTGTGNIFYQYQYQIFGTPPPDILPILQSAHRHPMHAPTPVSPVPSLPNWTRPPAPAPLPRATPRSASTAPAETSRDNASRRSSRRRRRRRHQHHPYQLPARPAEPEGRQRRHPTPGHVEPLLEAHRDTDGAPVSPTSATSTSRPSVKSKREHEEDAGEMSVTTSHQSSSAPAADDGRTVKKEEKPVKVKVECP